MMEDEVKTVKDMENKIKKASGMENDGMVGDKIKTQVDDLINRYVQNAHKNFALLDGIIDDELLWPEMRYVRNEILDCLLIGNNQAAITLTNHFLEKSLKMALIYHSTGGKRVDFEGQMHTYDQALADYGDSDLAQTINACAGRARLIDKETKETLHGYREKFRDPYSHANAARTFGDLTASAAILSTEKPSNYKIQVNKIASMPYMHGIIQKQLADRDAFQYFKYVYETHKLLEESVENPKK